MEREVQRIRNQEFRELEERRRREEAKKVQFVGQLKQQIEEKKNRVYLSQEEFERDRELVQKVVQKIIEEETRWGDFGV